MNFARILAFITKLTLCTGWLLVSGHAVPVLSDNSDSQEAPRTLNPITFQEFQLLVLQGKK
jgi:hypothetical protein